MQVSYARTSGKPKYVPNPSTGMLCPETIFLLGIAILLSSLLWMHNDINTKRNNATTKKVPVLKAVDTAVYTLI